MCIAGAYSNVAVEKLCFQTIAGYRSPVDPRFQLWELGVWDRRQSLTLSLRISEVLRKRLEDIRQFTAKRTGGIVSTSEIAKQLLESAREDRLEVVDLLARPTASLLTIRRKGESGQPLSRAEWTLLAYYVQQGVEAYAKTTLSRESFVTILKAFQAVYELRVGKSDKDHYYLGNLPEQCRPEGHKVSDPVTPDLVRQTVAETLRCVGNPAMQCIALHGARNLYVLLEDEKLSGVARLNEALLPYWRVLWRVAARGHYLERKEPVRDKESEVPESVYRPRIPSVTEGEFMDIAHHRSHRPSARWRSRRRTTGASAGTGRRHQAARRARHARGLRLPAITA